MDKRLINSQGHIFLFNNKWLIINSSSLLNKLNSLKVLNSHSLKIFKIYDIDFF